MALKTEVKSNKGIDVIYTDNATEIRLVQLEFKIKKVILANQSDIKK